MPFHKNKSRMKRRSKAINRQELGMQLLASGSRLSMNRKEVVRTNVLVLPVPKHLRLKDGVPYKKNYKLEPRIVKGLII